MRRFVFVTLLVLMFVATTMLLANTKITMDEIKIDTPKFKNTQVTFSHAKHSAEYADGKCDTCHPPLKTVVDAPENDKNTIHNNCRQCHSSGKAAKNFSCVSCHKPVAESDTAEE